MKRCTAALLVAASVPVSLSQTAIAGEPKHYVVVNEDVGVPVFPYDFKDRPYEVVGEVKAGVRKATVFSKSASQTKIYKELWERAEKLGADAVINASYGDSHVTFMSWGQTNATGTAIKFKAAAPSTDAVPSSPTAVPSAAPASGPPATRTPTGQ